MGWYRRVIKYIFAGFMIFMVLAFVGCKKKSEPSGTLSEAEKVVSEALEQTNCPVMDGPINKDLYTVYEGKKVYFCCAGCKEAFEKEPEKYLTKLPQFSGK